MKTIRFRSMIAVLSLLMVPIATWAHEGHGHQLMGTVTAIDASHLEMTTTEGKAASVAITADTKVFKGKAPAAVGDIGTGARVMVKTDGASEHPKAVTISLGVQAK